MTLTQENILMLAPNPAAAQNGRKLAQKGSYSSLSVSEDNTLYWAYCAGSGKTPYFTSIDFTAADSPICRCSCPSRQFPCKHALGLLYEIAAKKPFTVAPIPQELEQKRARQAARAAKKQEGEPAPAKTKKPSTAAQAKKIKKQLEGLEMAQSMVSDLLSAGLGTLSGASAKTYEKLAKDLGSYYLTGPQLAFSRIALAVSAIQREPQNAEFYYTQAMRELIRLHSTIQKSKEFLGKKLEQQEFTAEDNVLFEALGGVWRLEELEAIGSAKEKARLVQLSFDVFYDEARRDYIERGYWMDADTGEIGQTLNYRPIKALKYVKEEDSSFALLTVPKLCWYPGELNRRIRWENAEAAPIPAELIESLAQKAHGELAGALKLFKNQIKNTLSPKYAGMLLRFRQIGLIGEDYVLEDPAGARILLRDRPEDGEDHASVRRLSLLPGTALRDGALFGLMFYDEASHRICVAPYSILSDGQILRLQY